MTSPPPTRAGSGAHWPFILVGIIAVAALANGVLVYKAHSDPSFAVEPDYYQKALAWDQTMAQQRQNRRLGWELGCDLQSGDGAEAGVTLRATLRDRAGAPLSGATVRLTALHLARASRRLQTTLSPGAAGEYRGVLPLGRDGRWELRFEVQQGRERFTRTLERRLSLRGRPDSGQDRARNLARRGGR